jgi:uncharacterized protein
LRPSISFAIEFYLASEETTEKLESGAIHRRAKRGRQRPKTQNGKTQNPRPKTISMTASDIIRLLELKPHPEGGHYRETFRDPLEHDGRSVSTAIYFLLAAGEISRWHRIDSVEVWHWYAGAPLALSIYTQGQDVVTVHVGADLKAGERPQAFVPGGVWQSARSLGEWTLVGCTVAPGFNFDRFELAGNTVLSLEF